MNVAKQIKAYEDRNYNQWRITTESVLPDILKSNLIVKPSGKTEATVMVPTLTGGEVGKL